jgi:CheY-like chemotaxis protein
MALQKDDITVLIADDYPSMQEVLTDVLSDLGYQKIQTVSNPEQFWTTLSNKTPDIILLDTVLSYKSTRPVYGYEICHSLRMHPVGDSIGIIGMSADDYATEWYKAGADYFFSKTQLDPVILEDSLARLVQHYKSSNTQPF